MEPIKAKFSRYTIKDMNEMAIRRLKGIAQNWGGDIIEVPQNIFDYIRHAHTPDIKTKFEASPVEVHWMGIFWEDKIVVYTPRGNDWALIIHEMGHIFATKTRACNEDIFFGWEYALARFIKCSLSVWRECQSDYEIYHPNDSHKNVKPFGRFSTKEQNEILKHQWEVSRDAGLIVDNVPVAIR